MQAQEARQALRQARRVVVKVGTRVLVDERGRPDERRLSALVSGIAGLRQDDRELVLVSSGAIAAGLEGLGLTERPRALPELQMAAAVGQSRLMERYAELFGKRGLTIGQVLLTHDDLEHRRRHLNARNTMLALLRRGIIPIVNENDVVAVDEIRFGDNDQLAALVALLIDAPLLVLLTSVDGLQERREGQEPQRIPSLAAVTEAALGLTWGKDSALSTGGMASKLQAAQVAAEADARVVIADGRAPDVLARILAGEDVGTLIGGPPGARPRLTSKKRWIGFFHKDEGAIILDSGARRALLDHGRSLLAVGVLAVEGDFEAGALVELKDEDGRVIGRGLVDYTSVDIERIKGRRSEDIPELLGAVAYDAVIHRDNMVVFGRPGEPR